MQLSKEELTWLFKTLQQVDFLAAYSADELNELAGRMDKKTYYPGDGIIQQGGAGEFFFVIHSGEVSVSVERDKKEQFVSSLGAGDYFGEMSLLTGQPCVATVKAVNETVVYMLYADDFRFILMRNKSLVEHISRVISERRHALSAQLGLTHDAHDDLLKKIRAFFNLEN